MWVRGVPTMAANGRDQDADRVLTVEEAAARMRVNAETVRRWIRTGKLRAAKPSLKSHYRIPESELQRLLGRE